MITPAASYPERRDRTKLLVVDPHAGAVDCARFDALPEFLRPGDLLVVNDAATLPASLYGVDERGRPLELRLAATLSDVRFRALVFGPGSWREKTEQRRAPPRLSPGTRLVFGALAARVLGISELSPRLCEIEFLGTKSQVWSELYRLGRPVQYSHLAHELPLWAVQNVYAERPWAFEMPSAGRALSWEILLALKQSGVGWARVTHAAGLSATGDSELDARLPLPERYDVPPQTVQALERTRAAQKRVIAVGTSVVRALEGAVRAGGGLVAGSGETDLRIDHGYRPSICDGLLTGIHEPGESHHALLGAYAAPELLDRALDLAQSREFRSHELGDSMLVLAGALADRPHLPLSGVVGDRGVVQNPPAVGRADLTAAGVGAGDALFRTAQAAQ